MIEPPAVSTTTNKPPALEDRWKERIESWSASGLSKSAYCKSADVNYHQMIYWSRKLASASKTSSHDRSTDSKKRTGFVAVSVAPPTTALSLRLPNGIEIGGVQEQRLRHVLDLVSAR